MSEIILLLYDIVKREVVCYITDNNDNTMHLMKTGRRWRYKIGPLERGKASGTLAWDSVARRTEHYIGR